MIEEELKKLSKDITVCYNEATDMYEPRIRTINNDTKKCNIIKTILDYIKDSYGLRDSNLCIKLLLYYQNVNYFNARERFEILNELREDGYVKKLKK